MATGFSVYVNIGGKVDRSLAGAVAAAKVQVTGLAASLSSIGERINTPFIAVQKHIDATSKRFEAMQRKGRDMSFAVTAPTGLFAASAIKAATERAKAANALEALGEMSPEGRKEAERFADSIAAKYGDATGILKTFNELLKAGFDAKSAKGSLPAILSGAAIAGDMTGAELGGYVSKTVNQFKLGMSTVEEATASSRRIVDNLVYGAVKTVASTKDMAEAYKYVGSAAAAAGESVESTNAMIIALAREGQLGSEAGVALRSAYVRMVKPTKGGLATLSRLGLSYSDYVQPGQRSGAGIVAGLNAAGFDANARDIDQALSANQGSPERQRRAIYDAVLNKIGTNSAVDREAVMRAVDDAFAIAGSKVDLTKLLTDLRKKGANQGDLAKIFEGRQSVRMLALLKSDLEALLQEINRETPGFAEKTWAKTFQGLPKAVLQLDAAWKTFRNTIVEIVTPEIVGVAERLAIAVRSLAETSPGILRVGIGLAAVTAAAGPLLFAFGALGRVAVFGLAGISAGLALLLAPIGLVARAVGALGVALAVGFAGALARVRALALGLAMLGAVGGTGAVMAAIGTGLLAFGRAVLLFPITALRAIGLAMWALVANPVGIAITAVVASLAALGLWVYNNWEGIKSFFAGFGTGFMQGLGPAGDAIKKVTDGLGSAWDWLMKLLGPLDATKTQWEGWGAALGGAVAQGIGAVVRGIQSLIGFFDTVIGKAVSFGNSLRNLWPWGGGAAAGASPGVVAPPVAGARALGGPVDYGKAYIVGERGPELFMPGASGRVETNDTLRRLTADGTAAVAGLSSQTVNNGPVSFNPTFNITGDNPREIAGQIRAEMQRFLAELQAEQRGLLSD